MRKEVKVLSMVIAAALSAVCLAACQSPTGADFGQEGKKAAESESASEQEAEATQEAGWGEEEQSALGSLYLDMDLSWLERIDSSLKRYFDDVQPQEEFVLNEKDYDLYSVSKYDISGMDKIREMLENKDERDALDESFLALYPSMSELMQVINKIYNYTDLKSYLDDDYAKGREFHKELWGPYQEYSQNVEEFRRQFALYSAKQLDEEQQQAMEAGQTACYEAASALKGAKALQEELNAQGLTDKTILDMNLDTMQPLYDEFLGHVNAVLDLTKDEAGLSEGGIRSVSIWEDFVDAMKDTKTSMTQLLQTVKEKKTISISSSTTGSNSIPSYKAGVKEMLRYYDRLFHQQ